MPEGNLSVGKDGIFKYSRISFSSAGQDSDKTPPSQDEELFELLENVLPPVDGDFKRRWGYRLFNNPTIAPRRMYEFQGSDNVRQIVFSSSAGVNYTDETGVPAVTNIFNPTGGARHPRMVASRDYGFFADGIAADLKRWDGNVAGGLGVQKWGIAPPAQNGISSADIAGAGANVATGAVAWTNPGNITADDASQATVTLKHQISHALQATDFSFPSPPGPTATIVGFEVKAEVTQSGTPADNYWRATMVKAGGTVGDSKLAVVAVGGPVVITWGGPTDLWGTSWTPTDVLASNFGVRIDATETGDVATTMGVDYIEITLYYSTPLTVGATSAGEVTLVSGRKYTVVYKSSVTGHISNIAPFSLSTGPVTTRQIPLTNIPVSTDPQVDRKIVLATADGGDETLLYELVELPVATTSYTDNTTELELLTHNIYLETDEFGVEFGCAENDPPPNGDFPTKHRGRLYMAVGDLLYFSKSIDELATSTGVIAGRWEEAWPGDYFMDISEGAETVRGLLSDGQTLYIGTERRILRLFGEGPSNFSKPEVAFNDVGILNQDVWKAVFREGAPVGVMWLTPDLRLMLSDMNTYHNVGEPVQDILDSVNLTHASKAWATYVSVGEFNFYVLALPTAANTEPDTLVVYDLRGNRFVVWRPTDKLTAGLYNLNASGNARFLVGANTGKVYRFDPAGVQDRLDDTPVSFTATLRTSFQHFGNPMARKRLNWLQALTGDSGLLVTIAGASTAAEFASPVAVVTDAALVASPLGDLQVPLAGSISKDRSYRFQFKSTGTTAGILSGWSCNGHFVHDS